MNFRDYFLQANQNQSLNASQHSAIVFLREENSNLAEVVNSRAYSLRVNQNQSLNASQHPSIIFLR